MAQSRRTLSMGLVAFLVCGVLYIVVASILWGNLVNHDHILERYPLINGLAMWWWAIELVPLSVLTALTKHPLRTARTVLAVFVVAQLITWEGSILYDVAKAFGIRQAVMLDAPTFWINLLFGLILGTINILIQLLVFWSVRQLMSLYGQPAPAK